jgi:tetratricopeptide (TPR) repeat protein
MPEAGVVDIESLASRTEALIREGRLGAARPLIAAIARLAPGNPASARLTSACHMREGAPGAARDVLDSVIVHHPGDISLRLARASAGLAAGDAVAAAEDAAAVLLLDPHATKAKSLLGRALHRLGAAHLALPCLDEAFAENAADEESCLALAALVPDAADALLLRGLGATPRSVRLREALMRHAILAGAYARAAALGREAIDIGCANATLRCLAAHAAIGAGGFDDAVEHVAAALRFAPRLPWGLRLRACLAGRARRIAAELPGEDNADLYEMARLAGGTIAPGRQRADLLEAPLGSVLDCGAGTGLNPIAASDLPARAWHGIEASAPLRERAALRGLYTTLVDADPLDTLAVAPPAYAVILLNEQLGRVSDPTPVLAALRRVLVRGGIAVAAVVEGDGFTPHGVFAHRRVLLAASAAAGGLEAAFEDAPVLRQIEGLPMPGSIVRFRLA